MKLSHVDAAGRARMVDVGDKPITVRAAVAEGTIRMSAEAYRLVAEQAIAKGDVLAVSEVAGTLAAKHGGANPVVPSGGTGPRGGGCEPG